MSTSFATTNVKQIETRVFMPDGTTSADIQAPLTDLPIYNQGGTTYTVADNDAGAMIYHSNASATTITLPADKPRGFIVSFTQGGAGQITFSAGSGAAIQSRGSKLKTAGQYAAATAVVTSNAGGAAQWLLTGDLSS